jgi:hypothetical protein
MTTAPLAWIRTPDDRKSHLSADGQWMVSFGMGHIHPDHPRVWTLYRRTGKYSKGEGEVLEYTLGHHFTAKAAMKAASDAQAKRAFKFTFGTGGKIMAFLGYVGFAGAPAGSAQDKITTQAVITCEGTPTYYSA